MNHDSLVGGRGICLLEGGPHSPRCGGGGEKLYEHGRDGFNNFIKKQLILLEPESIIQIWEGEAVLGKVIVAEGHGFKPSTNPRNFTQIREM